MAANLPKDTLPSGEVLRRLIGKRLVHAPTGSIYTESEAALFPEGELKRYDPDGPFGSNKSGIIKAIAGALDNSEETVTAWASGRLSIASGRLPQVAAALKLDHAERFELYTAVLTPQMESLKDVFRLDNYTKLTFNELMNRALDACGMHRDGRVEAWDAVHQKAGKENNPEHLLEYRHFEAGTYEKSRGGGGNSLARRLRRIERIHDGELFQDAISGLPFTPEQVVLLYAKGLLPEGAQLKQDLLNETTFLRPSDENWAFKGKGMLLEELRQSHCVTKEGAIRAWSDVIKEAIGTGSPDIVAAAMPLTMEELGQRFKPAVTRQYVQAIVAGRNSTQDVPFPDRLVPEVETIFGLGADDFATFRKAPSLPVTHRKDGETGKFVSAEDSRAKEVMGPRIPD